MSSPSIKRNIVLSTAYQILTLITPFVTAPYISRVLEPDGIGVYSFTNSILSYFTMFAVLGTSSYGARQIARVRDDIDKLSKNFFEIELLSIITSSMCILLWLIMILCVTKYQVIYLILTISLVGCMADISWFFTGLEPYYPVNDARNDALYKKYKALADNEPNVIFGGRLAEYKYYDMASIVDKVMRMWEE